MLRLHQPEPAVCACLLNPVPALHPAVTESPCSWHSSPHPALLPKKMKPRQQKALFFARVADSRLTLLPALRHPFESSKRFVFFFLHYTVSYTLSQTKPLHCRQEAKTRRKQVWSRGNAAGWHLPISRRQRCAQTAFPRTSPHQMTAEARSYCAIRSRAEKGRAPGFSTGGDAVPVRGHTQHPRHRAMPRDPPRAAAARTPAGLCREEPGAFVPTATTRRLPLRKRVGDGTIASSVCFPRKENSVSLPHLHL